MIEQCAGIFLSAAGALFAGNAVIIHGNEKLGAALQSDDGELTERYIKLFSDAAGDDLVIEARGYLRRYLAGLKIQLVGYTAVNDFHGQHQWVYCFHDSRRQIAVRLFAVPAVFRGEYLGASLAAVENDAFVKDGKTRYDLLAGESLC